MGVESALWKKKWFALHGTDFVYMRVQPTVQNLQEIKLKKGILKHTSVLEFDEKDGITLKFDPKGRYFVLPSSTLHMKRAVLHKL